MMLATKKYIHESTNLCVWGYIRNVHKQSPSMINLLVIQFCVNQIGFVMPLKSILFKQKECYPEHKLRIINNSKHNDFSKFKIGLSVNGGDIECGVKINVQRQTHSMINDGQEGVECQESKTTDILNGSTHWMLHDPEQKCTELQLIIRMWKTEDKIVFCLVRNCDTVIHHRQYPCDYCTTDLHVRDQIQYQLVLIAYDEQLKKQLR